MDSCNSSYYIFSDRLADAISYLLRSSIIRDVVPILLDRYIDEIHCGQPIHEELHRKIEADTVSF